MKRVSSIDLSTSSVAAAMIAALAVAVAVAGAGCNHTAGDGASVHSFRYAIHWELRDYWAPMSFDQSGEVVLPDTEHATTHLVVDALDTRSELVRVGDARWVRGDLPYVDFGMGPLEWLGAAATSDLRERLAGLPAVPEDVDGAPAARYELDAAAFAALVTDSVPVPDAFAPPPATLWVSVATGLPVKFASEVALTGTPATLVVELRMGDFDDPSIVVAAPATFTTATAADGAGPAADAPPPASGGSGTGPWDRIVAFFGGVMEAVTGVDPHVVEMAADAAAEAAPSIAETIENVDEYQEVYPDAPDVDRAFRAPDAQPEEKGWLYNWFWGLLQ